MVQRDFTGKAAMTLRMGEVSRSLKVWNTDCVKSLIVVFFSNLINNKLISGWVGEGKGLVNTKPHCCGWLGRG